MSKQTRPKNHHFVPQHFLQAWKINSQNKKTYRYKRIRSCKGIECKIVSLKKTSSIDRLYDVVLPDGDFEIESSVVTPKLDEPGHKIINKIRSTSITEFTQEEKKN